jgi:hypothetical protein
MGTAEVRRGEARQRHPLRLPGGVQRLRRGGEFLVEHFLQRRADRRLGIIERRNGAPLFAPRQHRHQEPDQAFRVVVGPGQGRRHGGRVFGACGAVLQVLQRTARGFAVVPACILDRPRLRAEARQQGHLACQPGAQRVDGGQTQAPRLRLDAPVARRRTCQRRTRQIEGDALVRSLGRHAAARARQAFGDAVAHFAGGLVGEGDGDDFLGFVGDRQQAQVALRQ